MPLLHACLLLLFIFAPTALSAEVNLEAKNSKVAAETLVSATFPADKFSSMIDHQWNGIKTKITQKNPTIQSKHLQKIEAQFKNPLKETVKQLLEKRAQFFAKNLDQSELIELNSIFKNPIMIKRLSGKTRFSNDEKAWLKSTASKPVMSKFHKLTKAITPEQKQFIEKKFKSQYIELMLVIFKELLKNGYKM